MRVFDAAQRLLNDEWAVFYSVAWLQRVPSRLSPDGEVDFIILHPDLGAILIEVKGGRVSFDRARGGFFTVDRTGAEYPIDPLGQLVTSRYALLEKLRSLPGWTRRDAPLARALILPDVVVPADATLPPSCPRHIVIDREDLQQFAKSLRRAVDVAPQRAAAVELGTVVERYLSATVELRNPLRHQIADVEGEILRLTSEQFRTLELLRRVRRACIGGCAGSGKTLLAVEKAKALAAEGFRTLLTCYGAGLADHLAQACAGIERLEVKRFSQVVASAASRAGMMAPAGPEQYGNTLVDAIGALPDLRYDAIVVDEGQDFRDEWWTALECALEDRKVGVFYIFFDDNQRVFGDAGALPEDFQRFDLIENVRNARSIAELAVRFYDGPRLPAPIGPVGGPVERIEATAADVGKRVTDVIMRVCSQEGIQPRDVVVLAPAASTALVELEAIRLPQGYKLTAAPKDAREILLTSIEEFKGLERAVVIWVALDEGGVEDAADDTFAALAYVGTSRARSHLIVVGDTKTLGRLDAAKRK